MDRPDEVCKPGMYALIVGRHLALAYIDEAVSRTGFVLTS
jgi:hypothetical protein